jgi:hypothetical protein
MNDLCREQRELLAKEVYKNYYSNIFPRKLLGRISAIEEQHHLQVFPLFRTYRDLNDFVVGYYQNEQIIKSKFLRYLTKNDQGFVVDIELKVGGSRVDICKFNGISIGYEIKTEYDNYSRLNKQILDYMKIFNKLYIIVPEKNYNLIKNKIPKEVGVYTYRLTVNSMLFSCRKKAVVQYTYDSKSQLKVMTKKELLMSFSKTKSTYKKKDMINFVLEEYSQRYINSQFISQMKYRNMKRWEFFLNNYEHILDIDTQWVFKNMYLIKEKSLVI